MQSDIKPNRVAHFDNDMLHVIDGNEIWASGELILDDLVERYESHPGFLFVCRALSQTVFGANYCWWLFTDNVAINYHCEDGELMLHCWAAPTEAQRISRLVEQCCPF